MRNKLETLVIQVTSNCPNNCPQCYMQRGNKNISLDVAKKHIDQALELGARAVQITGGEPLVYPHLTELVRYVSEKGMYSFLATSGYGHSYDKYLELKTNGLTIICVSINDIIEENNSKTRDNYSQSLSAVQNACAIGLPCFVNVVLTDDNIERTELFGEYLKVLGVTGVNILKPFESYNGEYVPKISKRTIELLKEIVEKDEDFWRVENCFKEYWEYVNKSFFSCKDAGKLSIFVNVDGDISPCSKTAHLKYKTVQDMENDYTTWRGGCYDNE